MIGMDFAVPGSDATVSISTDGKTWHQLAPVNYWGRDHTYTMPPRPYVEVRPTPYPPHVGKRR